MTKTYTKIILGIAIFLRTLLGPISLVIRPVVQHADTLQTETKSSVSFVQNIAYAAEQASSINELAITLESVLKVVYVLLWPALFIAGLAMDNSLVYGEIFGLDKALFQFWQIMKNFANFALGFIFVWSILKYIFDIKSGKAANPKDLVVKLLIAAIGINTSWFIMGVLIDLSTALTVGIGSLPLQLMGDNSAGNKPLFGTVATIKLNQAIGKRDSTPVFHTWPGAKFGNNEEYLLPCYFENKKVVRGDGRRNAFALSDKPGSTTGTQIGFNQVVQDFCIAGGNIIGTEAYKNQGEPDVYDTSKMTAVYDASLVAFKTRAGCDNNQLCQTINTFTKKTEGYQGAFYTLYASLMNLATIHVAVPKSVVSITMEMLMKIIIALAYLIPLIILAVILVMRVGYLWLVIAFSPFIMLASIKELGGSMKDKVDNGILKKAFDFKNVISLLLLPVVVTFVISLSIVFLSSLSEGLTKNGSAAAMGIYQRQEGSYKCYDVAITNICLDMPTQDVGLGIGDYFSRTIMNLFGIALMWFAVMAALKSSEFTKEIAGKIQGLTGELISSANFIPIPGGGGAKTSLGAIGGLPQDISNKLSRSRGEGQAVFSEAMQAIGDDMSGKDKKVNDAIGVTMKSINNAKTFDEKKNILRNNITSTDNFAAQGAMNFGQADQAAAFANMLSEQAGLKHKFSNGQQLFTTDEGHAVLRKWFDNPDQGTIDKLGAMFSAKQTEKGEWAKVSNEIWPQTIPPSTPQGTTPPLLKLGTDDKAPFYIAGNKLIVNNKNPDNLIQKKEDMNGLIDEINIKLQKETPNTPPSNKLDLSDLTKKEYSIGDKKYTFIIKDKKISFEEKLAPGTTPNTNVAKNTPADKQQTTTPTATAENKDNTTATGNNSNNT